MGSYEDGDESMQQGATSVPPNAACGFAANGVVSGKSRAQRRSVYQRNHRGAKDESDNANSVAFVLEFGAQVLRRRRSTWTSSKDCLSR